MIAMVLVFLCFNAALEEALDEAIEEVVRLFARAPPRFRHQSPRPVPESDEMQGEWTGEQRRRREQDLVW